MDSPNSTVKQALHTIEKMQAKIANLENFAHEPIAIVGMGCRFPGNISSPDEYWDFLKDGKEGVIDIPDNRWDVETYYDPNPDAPGKFNSKAGGFLTNIDKFDAGFFGIVPREAVSMDPQQRLLLEVCWETLENANISPEKLNTSSTGVFVGVGQTDYAHLEASVLDLSELDAYFVTGVGHCYTSGRISYSLGLQGPCIAVDTACSSSLVTIHMACQSLRLGECNLALAGGVKLMITHEISVLLSKVGVLSASGKCSTFSADADGFVRGEGCGMIALKRLSDAVKDGDKILAVIKGSAVNHDGRSSGFTAPNGRSQQAVINQALDNAKLKPEDISYIEAHGTGTPLGDPIEVDALGNVFNINRTKENALLIGSVKTNFGHLEAAAGVAGVMKVVLAMQNKKIPESLHFNAPSPYIPWDKLSVRVVDKLTDWNVNKRVAGVSSFGMSGTNAHIILEEATEQKINKISNQRPLNIFTLSAKSEGALDELSDKYIKFLKLNPDASFNNICYTTNAGRTHFEKKLALIASSNQDIIKGLEDIKQQKTVNTIFKTSAKAKSNVRHKIAFLYTGQASQYAGMCKELYDTQPVFHETINECNEILNSYLEVSLLDVLYSTNDKHKGLINHTQYTQPALFAIEFALSKLLKTWGINPQYLIGHSVGEYVAATDAGVFSLHDALKLIAGRGRLMQSLNQNGSMVSIFASKKIVEPYLKNYTDKVSIAAINTLDQVVISGESQAIDEIIKLLQLNNIVSIKLNVSHAFHSPLMAPILAEFKAIAETISYHKPNKNVISNISGKVIADDIANANYWVQHIPATVNFAEGIQTIYNEGCSILIEIGPKPTLLSFAKAINKNEDILFLPLIKPESSNWSQVFQTLSQLFVSGVKIDWENVDKYYANQKAQLPTYPFQRKSYWVHASESKNNGSTSNMLKPGKSTHPLLGDKLNLATENNFIYQSQISENSPGYIKEHAVYDQIIFPGMGFLEMMLSAGKNALQSNHIKIDNFSVVNALSITEKSHAVQTIVKLLPDNTYQCSIFSYKEDEANAGAWLLHAEANLSLSDTNAPASFEYKYEKTLEHSIPVDALYKEFYKRGIKYGPNFSLLADVKKADKYAIAKIKFPENYHTDKYTFNPLLLDACTQVVGLSLPQSTQGATYIPVGMDQFELYQTPTSGINTFVVPFKEEDGIFKSDIYITDELANPVALVSGFRIKKVDAASFKKDGNINIDDWFYQIKWHEEKLITEKISPEYFPATHVLKTHVLETVPHLVDVSELKEYSKIVPKIEKLSIGLIVHAIQKIGFTFELNKSFTTESLIEQCKVIPSFHKLFNRLLQILTDENILEAIGDKTWKVIKQVETVTDFQSMRDNLLHEHPNAEAEIKLTYSCGNGLADVLTGNIEPLQLIFPNGDETLSTKLYRDSTVCKLMNLSIQKTVEKAIENLPADRLLRILEVGAGTGGSSAYVLPTLPADRTKYTFTDISPIFLSKAQENFKNYPFVEYKVLDIENDPEAQGFNLNKYDIIIAANVLHATKGINDVLRNVKSLLAPEGMLVLLENTSTLRWVDLVFGLTDGWWRYNDYDLRPSHPLMSANTWNNVLSGQDFTSCECLSSLQDTNESLGQSIFLARKPAEDKIENSVSGTYVLFVNEDNLKDEITTVLKDRSEPICVYKNNSYQKVNRNKYFVNPSDTSNFEQLLEDISKENINPTGFIHLWNTNNNFLSNADFDTVYQNGCYSVLHLINASTKQYLLTKPKLSIITRGAQPVDSVITNNGLLQTPLLGLSKVISMEYPELNCLRIDLDSTPNENEASLIIKEIETANTKEGQVAFRNGLRFVPRFTDAAEIMSTHNENELSIPSTDSYELSISENKTLDGLYLQPKERMKPTDNEVEIKILASGLNFRDISMVLNTYGGLISPIGSECAGEVSAIGKNVTKFKVGDKVIAISAGSFSKYITLHENLVVHKPEYLTNQEAATVPINFLTAYHALHQLAKIKKGDYVLIHSAAGGTGLAAVQIAQAAGAEVIGLASKPKWDYLKSVGVKHVLNSRTLEFDKQVMEITNGKGVDIVFSSFVGEFIPKSLSVMNKGGRYLEIALADWNQEKVNKIRPDISYFPINLATLYIDVPSFYADTMGMVLEMFKSNMLHTVPIGEYSIKHSVDAFRFMQQAKHIGKIVIVPEAENESEKLNIHDNATYIITGGYGAIGLEVASWLVSNGAKHLVLLGRNQPNNEVAQQIEKLKQPNVEINIVRADVVDTAALGNIIKNIDASPFPLKGIIHAAGVIMDDTIIAHQTKEHFKQVLDTKVIGSWNLHQLTLKHELDFFVLFSSMASMVGSIAQANYVAANSFLDGLAYYRKCQNLPALCINWGIWTDVGMAVRIGSDRKEKRAQGLDVIKPDEGIKAFDRVMRKNVTQIGIVPMDWTEFSTTGALKHADNFMLHFATIGMERQHQRNADSDNKQILKQLKSLTPAEQKQFLVNYLQELGSKVMGLQVSEIDPFKPLNQMGLDSLMSIELKNKVKIDLGVDINVVRFMEGICMDELASEFIQELKISAQSTLDANKTESTIENVISKQESIAIKELDNVTDVLVNVDDLSEEELDKLLNAAQ